MQKAISKYWPVFVLPTLAVSYTHLDVYKRQVLGSLLLLMVFGACCSMLLGPNLDVLLNILS